VTWEYDWGSTRQVVYRTMEVVSNRRKPKGRRIGGVPFSDGRPSAGGMRFTPKEGTRPESGDETRPRERRPSTWVIGKKRDQAEALSRLERLRDNRERLEASISAWVEDARSVGATWAEIGTALGVSQQAVSKRYGPKAAPKP
jgi:hypothetical protein